MGMSSDPFRDVSADILLKRDKDDLELWGPFNPGAASTAAGIIDDPLASPPLVMLAREEREIEWLMLDSMLKVRDFGIHVRLAKSEEGGGIFSVFSLVS